MMKKISPDKWKHFIVGIPLGAILQWGSLYYFTNVPIASGIAFLLLFIICYGFELFSKYTGLGHYDWWDAIAGLIGGVLGMIFFLLIIAKSINESLSV